MCHRLRLRADVASAQFSPSLFYGPHHLSLSATRLRRFLAEGRHNMSPVIFGSTQAGEECHKILRDIQCRDGFECGVYTGNANGYSRDLGAKSIKSRKNSVKDIQKTGRTVIQHANELTVQHRCRKLLKCRRSTRRLCLNGFLINCQFFSRFSCGVGGYCGVFCRLAPPRHQGDESGLLTGACKGRRNCSLLYA